MIIIMDVEKLDIVATDAILSDDDLNCWFIDVSIPWDLVAFAFLPSEIALQFSRSINMNLYIVMLGARALLQRN